MCNAPKQNRGDRFLSTHSGTWNHSRSMAKWSKAAPEPKSRDVLRPCNWVSRAPRCSRWALGGGVPRKVEGVHLRQSGLITSAACCGFWEFQLSVSFCGASLLAHGIFAAFQTQRHHSSKMETCWWRKKAHICDGLMKGRPRSVAYFLSLASHCRRRVATDGWPLACSWLVKIALSSKTNNKSDSCKSL